MLNKAPYHICEYGTIRCSEDYEDPISSFNELYLPTKAFNNLLNFVLENQPNEGEKDIPFSIYTKNRKKVIKVKNYVGIIETPDGTVLEILPKIQLTKSVNQIKDTKKIFLKMLSHLKDSNFINIRDAHLETKTDFPILEVFINSFVKEVETLFNFGVKSNYIIEEDNVSFVRGKLLVTANQKKNLVNKAHVYCQYTEFSRNIPQNRIIKSTLIKLSRISASSTNRSLLNKLIATISDVDESTNIHKDIAACNVKNRLFEKYATALKWSQVFLLNKTFTNFKGDNLNLAVLFPMEIIFQDYVSHLFSKFAEGFKIKAQDRSYFLIERHINKEKFQLKPDIYLENNLLERIVVDTKWKLLDQNAPSKNYNITSADMYQLFAYGKKYSSSLDPKLVLLYPENENFTEKLEPFQYYKDGLTLHVFPFNLEENSEEQIKKILREI